MMVSVHRLVDVATSLRVHQPSCYLLVADVLLNPSYHEGSPNVVKEAMACGLPVVAADCGDVRKRLAGCTPEAVVDRTPEVFARGAGRGARRGPAFQWQGLH